MNQAQVKPLKYDGPPLPTTTWDEEARIALQAYSNNDRWGSFAKSLLSQQGRWSEKQKAWVNKFIRSHSEVRRQRRNAEWRDECVRRWIAEVGVPNATAYAAELLLTADEYERRAEQGERQDDGDDGVGDGHGSPPAR